MVDSKINTGNTKIYFAPLEGVTEHPLRLAHEALFSGVDRYFLPFISANASHSMKNREQRDVLPQNNPGGKSVPQLLTNSAEDFVWYARMLAEMGYREINLNTGCPSGTVVAKRKGAGMLYDPDALDDFLEKIFTMLETDRSGTAGLQISVKTRIGIVDGAEADELIKVFNRYPIAELTVHPRVQKQFYRGVPDMEVFTRFYEACRMPLCYNGDVKSKADFASLTEKYPKLHAVMIGRGLLQHPALAREIRGGESLTGEELERFHSQVYQKWMDVIGDFHTVQFRMKELWEYLSVNAEDPQRLLRRIRKSKNETEYLAAVRQVGDIKM